MSKNKNPHPAGDTAEQGKDNVWADDFCNHDSTTDSTGRQATQVSDYLLPGRENAVPLKRLKELLNLDGRTVRLMIRAERLSGMPILADCVSGYYLPGSDHERARCVRSMRRRAAEIVKAADAIEGAARIG